MAEISLSTDAVKEKDSQSYLLRSREEKDDLVKKMNQSFHIPDLWKNRAAFLNLSEEEYKQSFHDVTIAILLKIMEGSLEDIPRLLDYIQDDTLKDLVMTVHPGVSDEDFFACLNRLAAKGASVDPYITSSVARPSYLNGIRDFSKYADSILRNEERVVSVCSIIYGEDVKEIYDIVVGELLYYRNDCIEALQHVKKTISALEKKRNTNALIAAYYLQLRILTITGETASSRFMMKEIRDKILHLAESNHTFFLDAMEVRLALYSNDVDYVSKWLETHAPDENKDFNLMDVYRYFAKLRCYLLYDKHLALINLVEKLRPYFEYSHRTLDMMELDMILAISLFKNGKKEQAFDLIENVLNKTEELGFCRFIASEGVFMFKLLQSYKKERGSTPYFETVLVLTRKVAVIYPDYLILSHNIEHHFTDMEKDILRLLEQGKTYEDIADMFYISVNTVRYHIKKIYPKLDVKNSSQAINKAKKIGLI